MSIFDILADKTKFFGLVAGCGVIFGLPTGGLAATIRHVTDAGDNGLATQLRAVIAAAASGDTVDFAGLATPATITLTAGVITISGKNLTIIGPGAKLVTISGNHTTGTTGSRIFYVASSWLTVGGLTFTGGYADAHSSPMDFGGAIEISNAATVEDSFSDCEFINNVAFIGGALDVYGGEHGELRYGPPVWRPRGRIKLRRRFMGRAKYRQLHICQQYAEFGVGRRGGRGL